MKGLLGLVLCATLWYTSEAWSPCLTITEEQLTTEETAKFKECKKEYDANLEKVATTTIPPKEMSIPTYSRLIQSCLLGGIQETMTAEGLFDFDPYTDFMGRFGSDDMQNLMSTCIQAYDDDAGENAGSKVSAFAQCMTNPKNKPACSSGLVVPVANFVDGTLAKVVATLSKLFRFLNPT